MSDSAGRWQLAAYRALLRLYPLRFRLRYGEDLERDFATLLFQCGSRRAWLRGARDLITSLPAQWRHERILRSMDNRQTLLGSALDATSRSVTQAIRSLLRSPVYTVTAVLTLTLGIGANTAVFSLANWILLRPVPGVEDPEKLATIRFQSEARSFYVPISNPVFEDMRQGASLLSDLAGYIQTHAHLATSPDAPARRVDALMTTRSYFETLGISTQLGRSYSTTDPDPQAPVVVVSDRLWRDHLGGSRAAVGSELSINGRQFTIIGVAPRHFLGNELPGSTDLWFPAELHQLVMPSYPDDLLNSTRSTPWFALIGRLEEGASLEAATAELRAAYAASTEGDGRWDDISPALQSGLGSYPYVQERMADTMALLMGSVAFVLLLATANVANLMLARATRRRREISLRQALGARRLSVAHSMIVESLIISFIAAVLSLALAVWMVSLFEGVRLVSWLPGVDRVGIDYRVLLFTAGVAIGTGLLFGVGPAVVSTRVDIASALRDGTGGTSRSPLFRAGMVVVQVALSLVLVIGATLFARSIDNLQQVDLGFDPRRIVSFEVDARLQGYEEERALGLAEELMAVLSETDGIEAVSASWLAPFGRAVASARVRHPGESEEDWMTVGNNQVMPSYFATLQIPMLRGRGIEARDIPDGKQLSGEFPVVINRLLADRMFPGQDPIGRALEPRYPEESTYRIVGVVENARLRRLIDEPEPTLFQPVGSGHLPSRFALVARTTLNTSAAFGRVRDALSVVDPEIPPAGLQFLDALAEETASDKIFVGKLAALFSALALAIAAVGLYGVVSYSVAERTREFGVRNALGAGYGRIVRLVLRRAFRMAGSGVIIGLIAAYQLTRLLSDQLYEVEPLSPGAFVVGTALISLVALAAAAVPAHRASRVDPMTALRQE